MDSTKLNTFKIQVKYIKKIHDMKMNEVEYLNKIKELRKSWKIYESVFDQEDVLNVRCDISILEGKNQEDTKLLKQYPDLIEHVEILCNLSKHPEYLDENPKNAVNWNKKSMQDIEKDYGDLINPK